MQLAFNCMYPPPLGGGYIQKKPQPTRGCGKNADIHAPLWEAPNGPPGGHFRAEEASPENHEPSGAATSQPLHHGCGY